MAEIKLQTLKVTPASAEINTGEYLQLKCELIPKNANVKIQWRSSSAFAITVDRDGLVYGFGEGDARIYAEDTISRRQHWCDIRVVNKHGTDIKKFARGWLGSLSSLEISSPCGHRIHPKTNKSSFHNGIDIAVPVGTNIYSPVSGTAYVKGQKNSSGKYVGAGLYIDINSEGKWYRFFHLSKAFGAIGSSKSVKEGEKIGETGNTGTSTGAHLHFEVRQTNLSGSVINSIHFLSDEITIRTTQRRYSGDKNAPFINKRITGDWFGRYVNVPTSEQNSYKNANASINTDNTATEWDNIKEVEVENTLAGGIWQIVKMAIDGSVADLRLYDVATSIQTGSLISFFHKVCQKPFVEFMGDTYGDQYYFIARKPPFDRKGMLKTMTTQGLFTKTDDGVVPRYNSSSPYEFSEDDLITSNLTFNKGDIYSWYQFYPIYASGTPSDWEYVIPAVLFPEYAAIWGSRDLIVRSQYRNLTDPTIVDDKNDNKESQQGNKEVEYSIYDLKYIIESNAYSPFVRSGSVTIMGNRKIKRGMFIRIKWKFYDEIFYVESVSQSYSVTTGGVNRTTTLQLSHGMIEDFMFNSGNRSGKDDSLNKQTTVNEDTISYFNLIDFGESIAKGENITMANWINAISKWKVNIKVFNFFLRRHQFFSRFSKEISLTAKS